MKLLKAAALFVCLGTVAIAQDSTTAHDLIKQVLAGFEAKDTAALARLTIGEADYRAYIWPRISAGNPSAKLEKFYALYQRGSENGLNEGLKLYGGQKMELVKVEPGFLISQGKRYRLLSTPAVTVRMPDGKEQTIRPIGALLERDGKFMVSTYFVASRGVAK